MPYAGGREVAAGAEPDHGPSGGLQRLGLGVDRDGRGLGDVRRCGLMATGAGGGFAPLMLLCSHPPCPRAAGPARFDFVGGPRMLPLWVSHPESACPPIQACGPRELAQLAEHRSPKPKVGGSSPSCPATPARTGSVRAPDRIGPSGSTGADPSGKERWRNVTQSRPVGSTSSAASQDGPTTSTGRSSSIAQRPLVSSSAGPGVRAGGHDDPPVPARRRLRPPGLQGLRVAGDRTFGRRPPPAQNATGPQR